MKETKPDQPARSTPAEPKPAAKTAQPAPRTEGTGTRTQAIDGETQQLLNGILADEFVLYVRTLNYHWNVTGMQFHSLHAFFETLYEQQAKTIDRVAEKVRASGGFAKATLKEYLSMTRIQEQTDEPPDPRTMMLRLAADHDILIKRLHETIRTLDDKYDDPGTVNTLTDLLEEHEKTAWMLRSHLDRELT